MKGIGDFMVKQFNPFNSSYDNTIISGEISVANQEKLSRNW